MKDKIHPEYKETTIACVCGEVIHTRSTKQNIHVDICSKCHPFFTGKQKLVDTAGRVERFHKRFAKTEGKTVVIKKAVPKAAAKKPKSKILSTSPKRVKLAVKKEVKKDAGKEVKKEK